MGQLQYREYIIKYQDVAKTNLQENKSSEKNFCAANFFKAVTAQKMKKSFMENFIFCPVSHRRPILYLSCMEKVFIS